MEQYIKKSALISEIKKEIKCIYAGREYVGIPSNEENMIRGLQKAEDIINTLEVKEANSVWHDASELPDETSLILLLLKDGNFIVADEKTAYIRELVDKWCYVSDI